jgi:hypothetical protein
MLSFTVRTYLAGVGLGVEARVVHAHALAELRLTLEVLLRVAAAVAALAEGRLVAQPGVALLGLRRGRSAEAYHVPSVHLPESRRPDWASRVLLTALQA